MKYKCLLSYVGLFVYMNIVHASEPLKQLQKEHPDEYQSAYADCRSWANDDGISSAEQPSYIKGCVNEMIGYLLETTNTEIDDTEYYPENEVIEE